MDTSTGSVRDKGPIFTIVTAVTCSMALMLVTYRVAHGRITRKKLFMDDYLIAASMVVLSPCSRFVGPVLTSGL